MSILLDEADAYERGMDDDLTSQTVRELAGTAYMAGRSAPPTAVEIEAVAKRLCYLSQQYAAAHQREMAEYHRRWMSEHPEKYAQYEAKRKRKRQLANEAVKELN